MSLIDRFRSRQRQQDAEPEPSLVRDWVGDVLAQIPRPHHPLTEDWEVSVAALLRRIPRVPRFVVKPLGLLDRFGAVHIGLTEVGFDGDEVSWEKVVEIRTHDSVVLLADQVLEDEIDRWRRTLPPVPGRRWVLNKIGELLVTLMLAVQAMKTGERTAIGPGPAGQQADDGAEQVPEGGAEQVPEGDAERIPDDGAERVPAELAADDVTELAADDAVEVARALVDVDVDADTGATPRFERIPGEIVYRGVMGRQRVKKVSLTSMLLLVSIPSATATMLETARSRGIAVVDVPADESDYAKAAQRADALVSRLRAFRKDAADEEAAERPEA